MKTLTTIFAAALLSAAANAQGVITQISGGQHTFYYDGDLQAPFAAAAAGDTIILGGGQYELTSDLFVTVPVVVIGTGCRADSSTAYSGRTVIEAQTSRFWRFLTDADGSELIGLTIGASVQVALGQNTVTSDVDNMRFKRCHFISRLHIGPAVNGSLANDAVIEECVLEDLDVNQSNGLIVRNCFIEEHFGISAGSNTVFSNCVFLESQPATYAQYANSVFLRNSNNPLTISNSATVLDHCLFVGNGPGYQVTIASPAIDAGGNGETWPMNTPSGAFPSYGTTVNYATFDFAKDYNINEDYVVAGNDGTPLGVYGGSAPWKDGVLPFNPHWSLLTTPANTANGVLTPVQMKASAQSY